MDFPVVICGCESWTIKKSGRWRIDAFELWYWRRLLRVPWAAGDPKSVLNIYWKDWCWSWNSNTLATWCEKLTHEKPLMLGKIEGRGEGYNREWDSWMASPTQWIWVWINSGHCWWTGRPGMLHSMGVARSQTQLSDWTDWIKLIPRTHFLGGSCEQLQKQV